MPKLRLPLALLLLLALLGLAACGDDEDDSAAGGTAATETAAATTAAAECRKDQLDLHEPGKLTIATDKPAYPPYFEDDDPTNGRGFESAVAYAIAGELGFSREEVEWTVVPFNASYAPGPKAFDFDVNQISITEARAKRVDFSTPYYTAPQAVVVPEGSPVAGVRDLAGLKQAKIGVQVGTTSLDAVRDVVAPEEDPQVFNDSNDVVTALKQGRVDAVVVDLPTAFYLTAAEVEGSAIAGQFEAPGGDDWGALLEKGSSLTPCVSQAIEALRASGELEQLEERWMGEAAGAPELR
jgi:polar amino acid transport system substrate-binding protein